MRGRWEEETGETQEYVYPTGVEQPDENLFYSSLLDLGDRLLICCGFAYRILSFDKHTGEFSEYEGVQDILRRMEEDSIKSEAGFGYVKRLEDGTVLLFDTGSNYIRLWDMEKNQWKSCWTKSTTIQNHVCMNWNPVSSPENLQSALYLPHSRKLHTFYSLHSNQRRFFTQC